MRIASLLTYAAVLVACSSRPSNTPKSCQDFITVSIDPAFTLSERNTIEAGMGVWSRGTAGAVCFAPGNDLHIIRLEKQEQLRPFDDEWFKHLGLHGAGRIWLAMDQIWTSRLLLAVTVHELGHALGIKHNETPGSCMRAVVDDGCLLDGKLPQPDLASYCRLRGCRR